MLTFAQLQDKGEAAFEEILATIENEELRAAAVALSPMARAMYSTGYGVGNHVVLELHIEYLKRELIWQYDLLKTLNDLLLETDDVVEQISGLIDAVALRISLVEHLLKLAENLKNGQGTQ